MTFIMCSTDMLSLDQLQALRFLFSFRSTVSVAEEQLKMILITKPKMKRSDVGRGNGR